MSNSFRYFTPSGATRPGVSFAYWTAPIFDTASGTPTDTTFYMLTGSVGPGKPQCTNTPARGTPA